MGSFFVNIWDNMVKIYRASGFKDILDIVIVSYLIYKAIKLVKETRAIQLLKGILILAVSYFLAGELGLRTISFLLTNIIQIGVLALCIVFQPELRRALEQVGRTKFRSVFNSNFNDAEESVKRMEKMIDSIVTASVPLSSDRVGALIVIERKTKLGEIISSGTIVNADPSPELIGNIFFKNSPLHDGAMVVRNGKIYAAGCYLPLSSNYDISKQLGTRHRAALGMSENSDAVILVVSEETGVISIAINGLLYRDFDVKSLRTKLEAELLPEKQWDEVERKPGFWKVKL